MMTLARNVLAFAAWLLVAGTVVQVFLAGLGVFRSPVDFETHRTFGFLLSFLAIGLLILAVAVRAPRRTVAIVLIVVLAFFLQSILVNFRASTPEIAALHPVNGFLIVLLTLWFARSAWRFAGRTAF
jgi:hypothetical protein